MNIPLYVDRTEKEPFICRNILCEKWIGKYVSLYELQGQENGTALVSKYIIGHLVAIIRVKASQIIGNCSLLFSRNVHFVAQIYCICSIFLMFEEC